MHTSLIVKAAAASVAIFCLNIFGAKERTNVALPYALTDNSAAAPLQILGRGLTFGKSKNIATALGSQDYLGLAGETLSTAPASGIVAITGSSQSSVKAKVQAEIQKKCGANVAAQFKNSRGTEITLTIDKVAQVKAGPMNYNFGSLAPCCNSKKAACSEWIATQVFHSDLKAKATVSASGGGTADLKCNVASNDSPLTVEAAVDAAGSSGMVVSSSGWNVVTATPLKTLCEQYRTACDGATEALRTAWACPAKGKTK